jgi:ComF family protein
MFLTPLLSVLAPHECLGCGAEGVLLCADCRRGLAPAEPRCYDCHRPDPLFRTCDACRRSSALYAVHALTRYDGLAKDLLWKLKFGRAGAAAAEIGDMLAAQTVFARPSEVIITHVPTATARVRQRGYDQAALIAKALARAHGVAYVPLLMRQGRHEQVGASRAVRTSQLEGAFYPVRRQYVRGSHIILVDDVVTTGATLHAATEALRFAGARRVEAIVFAQA